MRVPHLRSLNPRYDVEPTQSYAFVAFFIACQALGGLGLLVILVTALSQRIRRYATWLNFCAAWILSCVSYLLLAFLGEQSGDEPNERLCLVQAVLIYGAPVLTALSTLALVTQLWCAARLQDLSRVKVILAITIPWVAYFCILAEALVFGLRSPDSIERLGSSIYCAITTGIPGTISAIIVALVLAVTITIEVLLVRMLYINWRVFRDTDEDASVSRSLLVRIAIFGFFQLAALGSSVAFALQVTNIGPNGILAIMPLVAFLVFGTQKDILLAWTCHGRKHRPTLVRHHDIKSSDSLMSLS